MNTRYLFKRGKYYQYRRPIPISLQSVLNKKEFVISLRTEDHVTALLRYTHEDEKISAIFQCAEKRDCYYPRERTYLEKMAIKLGLCNISGSQVENGDIGSFFGAISQNIQALNSWPAITNDQVAALSITVKENLSWVDFFDRFIQLDRDNISKKAR